MENDSYDLPRNGNGETAKKKALAAIYEHNKYGFGCAHDGVRFQRKYWEEEVNSFRVVPPS